MQPSLTSTVEIVRQDYRPTEMNHKKQGSLSEVPSSPIAATNSDINPSLVLQEPQGRELVVLFQCGLEKEAFVFDAKDINTVKEQACIFLETKVSGLGLDEMVIITSRRELYGRCILSKHLFLRRWFSLIRVSYLHRNGKQFAKNQDGPNRCLLLCGRSYKICCLPCP